MNIKIIKRQLTDEELEILIEEVKKFFSPIVGYRDKWKKFDFVYIATINNNFVGVCGIEKYKNWLTLHPFVVLEKYHRKGVGSVIMKKIVQENSSFNIFIGSQNPVVAKIVIKLGFKSLNNFHSLPLIVIIYLLKFTLDNFNLDFCKALYKKRNLPRGIFKYFVKMNSVY